MLAENALPSLSFFWCVQSQYLRPPQYGVCTYLCMYMPSTRGTACTCMHHLRKCGVLVLYTRPPNCASNCPPNCVFRLDAASEPCVTAASVSVEKSENGGHHLRGERWHIGQARAKSSALPRLCCELQSAVSSNLGRRGWLLLGL